MPEKIISIFGTSRALPESPVYQLAFDTGKLLAEAGFTIANGGYAGSMAASAKAAAGAGAKVIGVTCLKFKSVPNKYSTEIIQTDCLDERLNKLTEIADAYVALPGGTGTLLEIAKVWELKNKHFIDERKPIILVTDFWKALIDTMAADTPESRNAITTAAGARQVADILTEFFFRKN